jgi:hypothetical protein
VVPFHESARQLGYRLGPIRGRPEPFDGVAWSSHSPWSIKIRCRPMALLLALLPGVLDLTAWVTAANAGRSAAGSGAVGSRGPALPVSVSFNPGARGI